MKSILLIAFGAIACVEPMPEWVAAPDPEPPQCSHEYPFEEAPDECTSNSYGVCCSWTFDESDGGTCRYDYCAYGSQDCEWELQYKDCNS
jgi:hypothetical protein